MLEPTADLQLEAGDVIAVAARREVLTDVIGRAGAEEIEDRDVLDVPIATYDVFVTSGMVAGRTLADIAQSDLSLRSVFLHSIRRGGQDIPVAPGTILERADVVRLTGPESAVIRAAGEIGKTVMPSETTDFVALGLGIAAGALFGAIARHSAGCATHPARHERRHAAGGRRRGLPAFAPTRCSRAFPRARSRS